MLKMSEQSRLFLEKNFPEMLDDNDLDHALLTLDEFITRKGLDENYDMTDFGHEAQNVYDDICASND